MKRFALGLALLLQAIALFSQGGTPVPGPAIARCMAGELRIRATPEVGGAVIGSLALNEEAVVLGRGSGTELIGGLKAPWLKILAMDGAPGWAFGGYLDTGGSTIAEWPSELDELRFDAMDRGKEFAEGSVKLRSLVPAAWGKPPRIDALFIKTAKSCPKLLFAENWDETASGSSLDLAEIEFVDLAGDARREVCVEVVERGGDYAGLTMRVYGELGKGYAFLGSIDLGSGAGGGDGTGDGFGGSEGLVSGPLALVEKGAKIVKLVMKSVYPLYPEGGGSEYVMVTKYVERIYEIVDAKLVPTRSREIPLDEVEDGKLR